MSSNSEIPKHQLHYHIVPPKGLLNDPNGLIQYNGLYHVFFQWNQHGTVHKNKSWGHATSKDLLHWEYHEPALEPDEWYDKDGVYSGSAVSVQNRLYLFYTGNVRSVDGSRESYQCLAVSEDGFQFEKKGPLFKHPVGYTKHVRDPKVWQDKEGIWWMVVGAQRDDLSGDAILYQSTDLLDWKFKGSLMEEELFLGYMWECPDILHFEEKDVFVFSPQGLETNEKQFQNIYQTGYITGKFASTGKFIQDKKSFRELDKGFEFYAPQSFIDENGRIISFGWVGVMYPEVEAAVPTRKDGWLHALSIPREITYTDGILKQQPVTELEKIRQPNPKVIHDFTKQVIELPSLQSELLIDWENSPTDFSLIIREDVLLEYIHETRRFMVSRTNWLTQEREEREVRLEKGLENIRLFLESSLIELFINDGEEVFTLRYFIEEESRQLSVSKAEKKENRMIQVYELEL
ncbi:glycoside hydrolase family 32 protein [Desemzia sp. RIT804]|uniref:glycoside hydrolase family 32 protein n=1 Tax=Desemzia sp. RIT 804 TaxID=2810209 RepID=UPI00194FCC5F|nr:glycoside hydrolase family 32 protein [Desemzia sp. RIT 804]MBM6615566.1 glycoside hydrolase family 32 protein [Desemzia sp. RIT 804]